MKHIIPGFIPLGGKTSFSAAIRQVLAYHNIYLSEEMIFGLSAGLTFFYTELKGSPYPVVSGKRMPREMAEEFSQNTGIILTPNTYSKSARAAEALKKTLLNNNPAIVFVDRAVLGYHGIPGQLHFGDYAVVPYGIDEEQGVVIISDRDEDGGEPVSLNPEVEPANRHIIDEEEFRRSRATRYLPFPVMHLMFTVNYHGFKPVLPAAIYESVYQVCRQMLSPEVITHGVKGIESYAARILRWIDYPAEQLRFSALNAYLAIHKSGGTGGGAYRKIYAGYLKEAAIITGQCCFHRASVALEEVAELWDDVGIDLQAIGQSGMRARIADASHKVSDIAQLEFHIFSKLKEEMDL